MFGGGFGGELASPGVHDYDLVQAAEDHCCNCRLRPGQSGQSFTLWRSCSRFRAKHTRLRSDGELAAAHMAWLCSLRSDALNVGHAVQPASPFGATPSAGFGQTAAVTMPALVHSSTSTRKNDRVVSQRLYLQAFGQTPAPAFGAASTPSFGGGLFGVSRAVPSQPDINMILLDT